MSREINPARQFNCCGSSGSFCISLMIWGLPSFRLDRMNLINALLVLYFFGVVLLSCDSSDASDNPFLNYQVDLSPFTDAIGRALTVSGTLNTSQCSIPDGGIMYTLSNHHMFPLLALRQKAMAGANVINCLQQRFITACLDDECISLCKSHKFVNCVLIKIPETPYTGYGEQAGTFQKNAYNYLVWLKWETMFSALTVASEAFYLDADVVMFGNPFPDTRFGRDQKGGKIPGEYEIMYQRERGINELGCGGSVNGGLIFMRNTTNVREKLIPAIAKHKQDLIQLTGPADQDLVGNYVNLVKYCTLPVERFMGYCVSSRTRTSIPTKVITFHTNCVAGLPNKMRIIQAFMRRALPAVYGTEPEPRQRQRGTVRKTDPPPYRPYFGNSTWARPGTNQPGLPHRFSDAGNRILSTLFGYFLCIFGGLMLVWMMCQYNLNRKY